MPAPVKEPVVRTPEYYKTSVNEKQSNKNHNLNPHNTNNRQQPAYAKPQQNNPAQQRTANTYTQPSSPAQQKQSENANQIRNAQQYHENTWKQIPQSQAQPQRQQQYVAPQRQQESRPAEQPQRQYSPPPSNDRRR
jgi:hypothetical protein